MNGTNNLFCCLKLHLRSIQIRGDNNGGFGYVVPSRTNILTFYITTVSFAKKTLRFKTNFLALFAFI